MFVNIKRGHLWMYFCVITLVVTLASGCTGSGQDQIQTAVARTAQTAVAEGKNIAGTQAVQLKETAVAQLATQLAHVSEELANTTPSPWATDWLPSDSQFVIDRINSVLSNTGLSGQGDVILKNALEFGVNPAFSLVMFRKEASFAASNTRARNNNNPGNIIATGACRGKKAGESCNGNYGETGTDGRFGVYPSMSSGIIAYFTLLSNEYKPGTGRNCSDIGCIISAYCPPSECDTASYVDQITRWTQEYQSQLLTP